MRNTAQVTLDFSWTELRSSVSRRFRATWAPTESQFLDLTPTQGKALFFTERNAFLYFTLREQLPSILASFCLAQILEWKWNTTYYWTWPSKWRNWMCHILQREKGLLTRNQPPMAGLSPFFLEPYYCYSFVYIHSTQLQRGRAHCQEESSTARTWTSSQ